MEKLPSSVESVISNDDLLTEILVRLPALSLVLFKSVSRRWFSLIKNAANVTFRHNLIDPLSGLFFKKKIGLGIRTSYCYDFLPLDIRIPLLSTNFSFDPDVNILHSCNGLLLCCASSRKLYVYNPSITNKFKLIPQPDNDTRYYESTYGGLKMAFDPTKSPHYKVIYTKIMPDYSFQIHTYSSETGNWNLCGDRFPHQCLRLFQDGVYWNDAIYWVSGHKFPHDSFFKLDIMNEHPVLTALRTPSTLDLYYECLLFESRGCLLLVGKDHDYFRHFTIYEKGIVDSEWLVKYIVNLKDIIKPIPKRWFVYRYLCWIVLEEREEDSFLVMKLDKKLVQYKIASKAVITISELGPNDNFGTYFQFIPSFANV